MNMKWIIAVMLLCVTLTGYTEEKTLQTQTDAQETGSEVTDSLVTEDEINEKEQPTTDVATMGAAEIPEEQVDFTTVFSEDYIRQMLLDYYRDFYSQNLNFEKHDITVNYSIDLPAEFEGRTEWSDDMYLYLHRIPTSHLTNQTNIEDYKYPFFVLYINSAGEQAHLIRTWHSREDSEDYNGKWRVLEEKSMTLRDVAAYPIEDFEGKDELYDQIEDALLAYWGDKGFDVSQYRFYIPNMYPQEWYPGASKTWNVAMYAYSEEDGRISLFLNTVECAYGEEPRVTGHRGVTPALGSEVYPENSNRPPSGEKYYRIIGREIN